MGRPLGPHGRTSAHALAAVLALGALGGCGATTSDGSATTSVGSSGAETPMRCSGRCTEGDACGSAISWRCACTEHPDVRCGGAAYEPGPNFWTWSCEPLDPRTDRGDGCPFARPADGERCEAARVCRYGEGACEWSGYDAHCEGNVWRLELFDLPPPP